MTPLHAESRRRAFPPLTGRQWTIGTVVFVLFAGIMLLSDFHLKDPILFFPASAIALGALTLEGIELWPFVFLASLFGNELGSFPIEFVILMPIAQTLQAILGAYLLRRFRLDPLFRRTRDMFLLFGVVLFCATIVPTFASYADIIRVSLMGSLYPLTSWLYRYASNLFSLLVLTPFILRWFSKWKFKRTWLEVGETAIMLAIVVGLDVLIFIGHIAALGGVPLIYVLLVPMFWIALRLRPRFLTLSLVLTSLLSFIGLIFFNGNPVGSPAFSDQLFQMEVFLMVLSVIFYTMVALEENRRVSSNLLRAQLATLENAVARVTSESEAKNSFIAVLAHELRNPLAPITSGIDFLKIKNVNDPDEVETLNIMEDRMRMVKHLLEDLLDISRISGGKLTLNVERVNLEEIVRRALVSTVHLVRERHQQLTFKEPEETLIVNGDPVRLEQIFSNLLTNASKYSESGAQIMLSLSREGPAAKIVVKDTGIGIPPEAIENIFQPFYQLEQGGRAKKGLGIGLALVRNFVELHQGTIRVESEGPGKGSTFTIHIPLAE